MTSGIAQLDEWIERFRKLSDRLGDEVAREAAPLVDQEVKRTAAAGTTPTGEPWAPRKKDGGRPMAHAAQHITTTARGPLIDQVLTGPDAIHHKGLHGEPRRQVIPDTTRIPPGVARAVLEGARRAFRRLAGGA